MLASVRSGPSESVRRLHDLTLPKSVPNVNFGGGKHQNTGVWPPTPRIPAMGPALPHTLEHAQITTKFPKTHPVTPPYVNFPKNSLNHM
jgi:hypothetical protein